MKKLGLFLPLFGLVFATTVYAYSGTHNFLSMRTITSDGHNYVSEYKATGTFPFNGSGLFDRSKVSLKGTFTITQPTIQTYCTTLKGTLSSTGGKLTATEYSDANCRKIVGQKEFIVLSYTEDSSGNINIAAKDGLGISYITTGIHQYSR